MEPDPASTTGALLIASNGYNYVENEGTVNSITYPRQYTKTFTPDTSYDQRLIQ